MTSALPQISGIAVFDNQTIKTFTQPTLHDTISPLLMTNLSCLRQPHWLFGCLISKSLSRIRRASDGKAICRFSNMCGFCGKSGLALRSRGMRPNCNQVPDPFDPRIEGV